jgi:hypothetical protein
MAMKYHSPFLGTAICVSCVLIACANYFGPGTGSDTPNSLSGSLVNTDGSAGSNSLVQLIPSNFDIVKDSALPSSRTVLTDSTGAYRFDNVHVGTYTIQSVHQTKRTRALAVGIRVLSDDPVTVAADTLRRPGTIRVMLPDSVDAVNGYVYVPGTTIGTLLAGTENFVTLDSVPSGVIPVINYAVRNGSAAPRLIADSVGVAPDSTTIVEFSGWKFSRQLLLNTTASGANVAGAVYHFPVLVRLTSGNFDFTKAANDGRDIRFAKSNGTVLPFEIERWDSVNALAEIWVGEDTVLGNSNAQMITMFFGNADALSASSSGAVFDTAAGFQGVWHLAASGNAQPDATANHYDGIAYNVTTTAGVAAAAAGAIGNSQQFNGTSSYVEMAGTASGKLDFPEEGNYSVSAWAYEDTLDGIHDEIASKGWNQYFLEVGSNNTWEFNVLKSGVGWDNSSSPATSKAWSFVVGVRSGTSQYLYVNGECVDSVVKTGNPTTALRSSSDNFKIGTHTGASDPFPWYFKGEIDEVRVMNTSPSADWIKLCYMNQKAQDALVVFK